jgi:polyisoprenoid-binding protein YceI
MRRTLVIAGAVLAVLVIGGAGATYAYFFSGLRTAPKPLALTSPSPASTPSATITTPGSLAGKWTVGSGSIVGYRVREQFVGQSSPHEAVAQTSDVSGGLTLAQASSGLTASDINFTAQVGSLKSVDSVAGFNVTNRDRIVSNTLQVARFPTASFQAASSAVPAELVSGRQVTLNVPGKLTVHGVTRDRAQVTGQVKIDMTDFGIQPPQVGFTEVESATTIEFQLLLARS